MSIDGLLIALFTYACVGLFHPIVIKAEYYFTKRIWPVFLVVGIASIIASLFIANRDARICLSVFGMSCMWSIHELFMQEKRVEKGWFPRGRGRR